MKHLLIICFLIYSFSDLFGQSSLTIEKISRLRQASINQTSDWDKLATNDSLILEIEEFLNQEGSFKTNLSEVPYLGDLKSPDLTFRIITWNVSMEDGTYKYYCYIQNAQANKNGISWYKLTDKHFEIKRMETRNLDADNWFGCLYYTIIPFKQNKNTLYALLGWEGHNKFSNRKVIECLYFDKNGTPRFGKTVFKDEKITKRRVVFEYSKDAYLLLRYNPDLKSIIFNRLEPMKPELEGLFAFYQPILTYDSFVLKKGNWLLKKDINPTNNKDKKIYNQPKSVKVPKK